MQDGSLTVEHGKPDVWCFRWREAGPDGCKLHRRIVLGSADDLKSLASARRKERALHAVYGSEGDDLDRLFDTVKREKGQIDVLFTSAGKGEAAKLGEIQAEGRIWLRA